MRPFLLLLTLVAVGGAAYEGIFLRSSYSGLSFEQLSQLKSEAAQLATARAVNDRVAGRLTTELLAVELTRRLYFYGALGAAALFGLGFALAPRAAAAQARAARPPPPEDTEVQFLSALRDPRTAPAALRRLAAAVLGVAPDAVPHDVEAACRARMQERDLARIDDMAPEYQPEARVQRDALMKARAVLLAPRGASSA